MTLNPYDIPGEPAATRRSLVVFLDLLGFRQEIVGAFKMNQAQQLLRRLKEALDECYAGINGHGDLNPSSSLIDNWTPLWTTKAFTDNIVLGCPLLDHDLGEGSMGSLFIALSEYQMGLIKHGFFVRGAMTVGEHYMDDKIVFGDALLEAVELEKSRARDPRIILSRDAKRLAERHLQFYRDEADAPQFHDLLIDSDGECFLSYLDGVALPESPELLKRHLDIHARIVSDRLRFHFGSPSIWAKYAWIAEYHNFICAENEHPTLQIDPDAFRRQPKRAFGRNASAETSKDVP